MPKRKREPQTYRAIYRSDEAKLKRLNAESNRLLEELAIKPADSWVVSRLNAIEVTIIALTKESTIEY